jgi:hypothetical protein
LKKLIHNFYCLKSSPIIGATSVIFTKLPKVNSDPIGENSPNLVTLPTMAMWPSLDRESKDGQKKCSFSKQNTFLVEIHEVKI